MLTVLFTAKLQAAPQARVSKAGRTFVTARAGILGADGQMTWASLTAFSESAAAALMTLAAGDALAVAGTAKLAAYTPKSGGDPRAALDVVVDQVLTHYQLDKRRKAAAPVQSPPPPPPPTQAGFDDDSAWLDGLGGRQP